MKFLRYLPLLLIFGVISMVSCSDNDDPVQEPTTTLYKANLYLKSWHDSTKVATELPHIEDTFLKYLGANTLKSFSISEGSEGVNDAAVLRQCRLAAAVLDNEEYDGAYVFSVVKAETNDTLFVFEPTPSNSLSDYPLDGMAHSVLSDDDNQRPVNYYICDVAVSAAGSASNAQVELTNRGYSVVTSDLNDGVGGDYVYIGIKYSTNIYDAISAFYILVGTCIVGDFTKDSVTYSMVPSYGDDYGSLNSGTGGKDMWLYFTKEGKAVVENIKVVESNHRMEGDDLIKGLKSDMSNWDNYRGVDINTGAGGKYRYLRVVFSDAKKPTNYTAGGNAVLKADDDAAAALWGNGWRMPTRAEISELCDTRVHYAYSWEWKENYSGVAGCNGYLITYKGNNNSIFLPVAGSRLADTIIEQGNIGCYWSSTADDLFVEDGDDSLFEAYVLLIEHYVYYSSIGTAPFFNVCRYVL